MARHAIREFRDVPVVGTFKSPDEYAMKVVGSNVQKFFIPGQLPGLNEVLAKANKRRGKWNAYDDLKRSYGEYIGMYVKRSKLKPMTLVAVAFHWVEPNRKRDKDNIAMAKKFILDALVETGVLPNDGWANVEGFSDTFAIDKQRPGVWVTLTEAAP